MNARRSPPIRRVDTPPIWSGIGIDPHRRRRPRAPSSLALPPTPAKAGAQRVPSTKRRLGCRRPQTKLLSCPTETSSMCSTSWRWTPDPSHPRHDRIAVIRSVDGGLTWSKPTTLATSSVAGVTDPQTPAMVRAGDSFTDIAVDPRPGTNTIYAVWGDARFARNQTQQIALAKSTDGGRTWNEPVAVSTDQGTQAFVPSVAVNDRGDVAVTYYSLSASKSESRALMTQYWITLSPNGAQTWSTPQQVTPHPFNLRTAPYNGGFFLGEYQGLAGAGPFFVAVATFANGRSLDNRTDIFSCTATLGAQSIPPQSGTAGLTALACRNSGLVRRQ